MSKNISIKQVVNNSTLDEIRDYLYSISTNNLNFSDALYASLGFKKIRDLEMAVKVLSTAIYEPDKIVPIHLQKGIYNYELGDYKSAIIDFNIVIDTEKERNEYFCFSEAAFYATIISAKLRSSDLTYYISCIDEEFQTYYEGNLINKSDLINLVDKIK